MELVITGESHINKKFKKVVNKKEQNPVAKKLRTTKVLDFGFKKYNNQGSFSKIIK